MTQKLLETALAFIGRGRCPVPIAFKGKRPTLGRAWQEKVRAITAANAYQYFNGRPQNIGVLLGAASGGEVDVDLDCAEAIALAAQYLPPTPAVFGRASKPRSHWIYRTANPQPTAQHRDAGRKMIAEHRADNVQSVYPPSIHQSGEAIRWDEAGEPAIVDGVELAAAVARLADAVRQERGEVKCGAEGRDEHQKPDGGNRAAATQGGTERCRCYLATLPDAVSGAGGSDATLRAACECYRFGLSDDEALATMNWFNAAKCAPAWTAEELAHKLDAAKGKVAASGATGIRKGSRKGTWHNALPAWIGNLKRPKLRTHQIAILQTIANRCDAQPIDAHGSLGWAFIGYEELARSTGMGTRTAIRHVKFLVSMKLLVKDETGGVIWSTGECRANVYGIPGIEGMSITRGYANSTHPQHQTTGLLVGQSGTPPEIIQGNAE